MSQVQDVSRVQNVSLVQDDLPKVRVAFPLWRKAWRESVGALAAGAGLLFGFSWLFVWLSSMINFGAMAVILGSTLFKFVEQMVGVPMSSFSTPEGKVALLYMHLITQLTVVGWAVARGSDAVSGEISRGGMEFLLAAPIPRWRCLAVNAASNAVGLAVLCFAVWLGVAAGVNTVAMSPRPALTLFIPATLNLFAYGFCIAGFTTLFSSFQRERRHTIAWAIGFCVLNVVIEAVGRGYAPASWLLNVTYQGSFQPQLLITQPTNAWSILLRYNAVLLLSGLAAYLVSLYLFHRRDIPAPI